MELLAGNRAIEAARELLRAKEPLVALAVDPAARDGSPLSVVAVGSADQAVLIDAAGTPALGTLLAGADRPLGAYDAKPVHRALLRSFGAGPSRWACIKLSEILLASGRDVDVGLDATFARYDLPVPPPPEAGLPELAEHTRALSKLVAAQIPALRAADLVPASKLEAAAVAPIAEMEHHGMPFDAARWRALSRETQAELEAVAKELASLLGGDDKSDLFGQAPIDLGSDAAVKARLHALGHRVPDMRRPTLAALPSPLGPALTRYHELTKLTSTYGEAFLSHVAPDGRIHPAFEQIGASTGRMACHAPNLQAMVKDDAHRDCFRASEGRRLVTADYGACELRILTEMSGDPVFAEAFRRGEDLHARVATAVFGVPVSKTEHPELRARAKAVNFGLVYGMGPAGLARATGVSVSQAQQMLDKYFRTFPKIRSFLQESAREALRRGFARTLSHRRLFLSPSDDRAQQSQLERIARNMPIQGTSADIIKIALARLRRRLAAFHEAWLVNAVHDEIVVECDEDEANAVAAAVAEEMRKAGAELLRSIELTVDVEIAPSWRG